MLTGIAFVLSSFFMIMGSGWAYTVCGGVEWMVVVICGVGAADIDIIAMSAYKLTRKNIGADRRLRFNYLVNTIWTVVTESETVLISSVPIHLGWIAGRSFLDFIIRASSYQRPAPTSSKKSDSSSMA